MPHIVLEHSDNIKDKIDYSNFCTQIHDIFLQNGYNNPNALKSRYVIHDKYVMGGDIYNSFVHLNISVLAGKPLDQLQNIMKQADILLRNIFTISNNASNTSFSIEIREMNNELYLK